MASERYSVVIIQVFLQILCLCHAGRNYHIIAPHNIRSNSIYSVVISMYAINRTCQVKVSITGALFKSSKIVYVEPRSVKKIDFTPPELKHGEYTLSAVATSGLQFDYAIKLNAIDAYNVFVQTDKAVYKPRDLVIYHVLCVDEKTRPLDKVVSMVITDGAASVVEDINHIQLVNGAYAGKLQLSKRAAVGNWSLRVILGGTDVELKTFQVLKVSKASAERGEFKVTIDTPFEVALPDKVLPIRVLAYYENRTPVEGTATVTLQVKGKTDHNELVTLKKTVNIDGVATVNFNSVFDLIKAYDALTLYFEITASVTNTVDIETATSHVNVHRTHTYEVTPIDMPTTFSPNETLIFEYTITYQKNLRIAANTPITMALVDAIGGKTITASPIPATDGSTFTFRVEIPQHFKADQLYAQLKIGDKISRSDVLERGLLVAENVDPLKPYNTHFTVSNKGGISDIVYTIVSVDQIVESGYIKTPEKGSFDFRVLPNLTESDVLEMGIVDTSYLYLHYFVCSKLVFQKRKLFQTRNKHIGNTLSNFIALYHSVIDDEIILSFVTQSDSFVGILASEDVSTSGNPLEDMNAFMKSVSEVGRLVIMTDATFNDGPLPNKPKPKPIRKRVDEDGIPIIWYFAGYQNTQMSLVLVAPVPNWSKRWMVSAYSLHPLMGFAYSKVLMNKYPLMNVTWPESVESGTNVVIPVTLYNNEQETRDIRLYVYDLNNIELVTQLPTNYTLPAHGNKTESLNFRVTKSGSVKVSIEAVSDEFQQYVNKMSTTTSGSGNNTKSPKEANTDKPPKKEDEGRPKTTTTTRKFQVKTIPAPFQTATTAIKPQVKTTPATRPTKKKILRDIEDYSKEADDKTVRAFTTTTPTLILKSRIPNFFKSTPPPPPLKKKPRKKESEGKREGVSSENINSKEADDKTEGASSETGTSRKPNYKTYRPLYNNSKFLDYPKDHDEHIDLPPIKRPKLLPRPPPAKKKSPKKESEDKREEASFETANSKEADDRTEEASSASGTIKVANDRTHRSYRPNINDYLPSETLYNNSKFLHYPKPKDKPNHPIFINITTTRDFLIDDDEHIDIPLIKNPPRPPPSPSKKKPPKKESEDKSKEVSPETISSKAVDDKTEGSSSETGTSRKPKDKPDRPIFNNTTTKDLLIDDDEHIDIPLIKDPTFPPQPPPPPSTKESEDKSKEVSPETITTKEADDTTEEPSCERASRRKPKDKTDTPLWPPRPPPPEKKPPKKEAEDKTEGASTETANSKEADDKTEGSSSETATTKKPKDKTDAPPFPPRPPPPKKKPKHYHVTAPYNIRSHSNYSLQIAVLASVKCKVKVTIAASSSFSVTKVVTVGPRSVSKVDFELAELGQGEHTLSAVSTSGIEFDHKMPLNVIDGYNVFVQTDKAVYQPGDLVQYHVLCVDDKTRPKATNTPLSIELTDGASNSPVTTSTINLFNGAYTGEFQLSEGAAVGNWSVKVRIDNTIVEDNTFQVLKIPQETIGAVKFTVVIDVPVDVTISDRVLQFRVLAYYAHGSPVKGKATITLEVAETSTDNELVSLVKVVDIDGVVTVDLNAVFELMKTFDAPVFPVQIKAAVEHAVSREIETATTKIRVHRTHSYRITPIDIPFTFTLNESLTFIYSITYQNSMVIDASTSVTMLVVAAEDGLTIPSARIPEIDASMYTFRVEIPQNFTDDQAYAQLKIGDDVSRLDVLERGVSVAENFDPLKPYNTHFNVSQADEICDFVYTVVSGDQIVESGYIKVPKQGSFDFQVLQDMSEEDLLEMGILDSSFLHMYYFVGDQLVLQKRKLFRARNKQIANTLSNFILLYHSVFDDSISISFVTQSDSFVGILGSEDVSSAVQALDDLHEFMKSVSEVGGLVIMTDGVFNDTVLPKRPKQKPKRKAVHEEKIPKTWFFKSYQNSKASLGLVPSFPDWSKPWLVSAYSLHPRMGFAYSRFPMKMKYPLVTVAWPETDTSLDFPLTLHNREEQSRSIRWLIYDVQNMQLLSDVTGNMKLDANDIKTEIIRFRSNKSGKFNFKVQAVSDHYHQYLYKTIVAGPQHQSSYVNTTSDNSRSKLVEMSEAARKRLLNFLLNVTAVKNS